MVWIPNIPTAPKKPFQVQKFKNFTRELSNFGTFLKLKVSQVLPGCIRLIGPKYSKQKWADLAELTAYMYTVDTPYKNIL